MGGYAVYGERSPKLESAKCPIHNCYWDTFSDEELLKTYGVEEIYYCATRGCDQFDFHEGVDYITGYCKRHKYVGSTIPEIDFISCIFKNTVRLKILFFKQKLAADK